MLKEIIAALAVALLTTTATMAAGTYDDGKAAHKRGDYAEAEKHWRVCAVDGSILCQTRLGLMYADGDGVPQDYAEAAKWYRLAAEQGFMGAQYNLGAMYLRGRGVPQDFVFAHMWFNLSAAQGYEAGGEVRDQRGGPAL